MTVDAPPMIARVEQRGIDYIPPVERWARPRDLAGMWAGSGFNFEYLVYGALLMTFGFSFAQAVVVILVGNLSYVLLGLCSLQAPQAGTTTFMINRSGFGPNGSRLIALFNWLTQVGFETEGLVLVVLAAEALASKAGVHAGTGLKVLFIALAALVQMVLPFLGHATVVRVLRWMLLPFLAFYAILAALTLGKAHFAAVHHGADWETFMVGLAFVITLSGLGWVENGNDYSRYLPADASKPAIVGWVTLGGAVPEILMMLLGASVATYVPTVGGNPIGEFPHAFAGWFLVPFLVVVILQLFAINSIDLYSSGVTLQALGLRLQRWQAVLLDTVLACGLTVYAVFSSSFSGLLQDFVEAVIVWIAPWCAIFLVDWVLHRFSYSSEDLQVADRRSRYWRRGGVHWPAIVAQVAGGVAAVAGLSQVFYLGSKTYSFHGWVSGLFGGKAAGYPDFSVYLGLGVAAVVYAALAAPGIRRGGAQRVAALSA